MKRMNKMLLLMLKQNNFKHVHYVPVEGKLNSTLWNYRKHWDNELHPNKKGFKIVAAEFHTILKGL